MSEYMAGHVVATIEHYIAGTRLAGSGGRWAEVFDPASGRVTGRVPLGVNPQISTSYSLDGQSWSQDRIISAGTTGNAAKRLVWWQQGMMRNFRMQRFRGTSAAHLSFLRLEAQIAKLP